MAVFPNSSYDAWLRVYGDVYEALPQPPEVACPNWEHKALRLEFVADETDRIGYAMFWCDFCRFGIRISRTWVPTGVEFHPMGTPQKELRKIVPEYKIVYPAPTDEDPEGFEEVRLRAGRHARPEALLGRPTGTRGMPSNWSPISPDQTRAGE